MAPEMTTTRPPSTSTSEPMNETSQGDATGGEDLALEPGSAPISVGMAPRRIKVRQKPQDTLTAYQTLQEETLTLPTGFAQKVWPGTWVICRGAMPIDLLATARFEQLYEPIHTGLLLPDPMQARLERTLGIGSTRNAEEICLAVERLADIRIGAVRVDFTPGQLEELARKAAKNGISIAEEVQRVVDHLSSEVFWDA